METNKKIFIANDHAGFQLKNFLIKNNPDLKWDNLGVFDEKSSDYPEQSEMLCRRILDSSDDNSPFGVLVCGSGQGMAIKANRFPGIRAALVWNEKSASLAREHNNANVLCLGARLTPFEEANHIFKIFIGTPFKGGRHLRRVKNLD